MTSTRQLHDLGQSLWLDNITRELLDAGTLRRYIEEFSITGLTSNPSIFDGAIGGGEAYDAAIREKARMGQSGERLFIELALEDPSPCRGSVPPGVRRQRSPRWLGLDGSLAAAGR